MLYVVTASHNRKEITKRFAKCLKASSIHDYKLVLVDDGSTDGTSEAIKEILSDNLIVLRGNGNLWWGGALHMAYKWLCKNARNDDCVLFSNDDVLYSSDYLEKGMELITKMNNQLLLGLAYSDQTGALFDAPIVWDCSIAEGRRCDKAPWRGNCSSTRSLFCKVFDVKKIGGFHPIILPHYLSDYEWTIRACKKGYTIVSNDELFYTMSEAETGNRDRKKLKIRQLFSKKSNMNPFYRLSFIFLTVPVKYWGKALRKQFDRIR